MNRENRLNADDEFENRELEFSLKRLLPSSEAMDPAVTFYRAGWEACLNQSAGAGPVASAHRKSWQAFVGGAALGIAASMVTFLMMPRFESLRDGEGVFASRSVTLASPATIHSDASAELAVNGGSAAVSEEVSSQQHTEKVGVESSPERDSISRFDFAAEASSDSQSLEAALKLWYGFRSTFPSSPVPYLDPENPSSKRIVAGANQNQVAQGWRRFCSTLGFLPAEEWSRPIRHVSRDAESLKFTNPESTSVDQIRSTYAQLLKESLL